MTTFQMCNKNKSPLIAGSLAAERVTGLFRLLTQHGVISTLGTAVNRTINNQAALERDQFIALGLNDYYFLVLYKLKLFF